MLRSVVLLSFVHVGIALYQPNRLLDELVEHAWPTFGYDVSLGEVNYSWEEGEWSNNTASFMRGNLHFLEFERVGGAKISTEKTSVNGPLQFTKAFFHWYDNRVVFAGENVSCTVGGQFVTHYIQLYVNISPMESGCLVNITDLSLGTLDVYMSSTDLGKVLDKSEAAEDNIVDLIVDQIKTSVNTFLTSYVGKTYTLEQQCF